MPELNDLKAKAYDILAQIQALQQELAKVNQQIAEAAQKPLTPTKED